MLCDLFNWIIIIRKTRCLHMRETECMKQKCVKWSCIRLPCVVLTNQNRSIPMYYKWRFFKNCVSFLSRVSDVPETWAELAMNDHSLTLPKDFQLLFHTHSAVCIVVSECQDLWKLLLLANFCANLSPFSHFSSWVSHSKFIWKSKVHLCQPFSAEIKLKKTPDVISAHLTCFHEKNLQSV